MKRKTTLNAAKVPKNERIRVIHVYKDFDVYNGLIETFMLLAEKLDKNRFDFRVCVFNHTDSKFARLFRSMGGQLDSLEASGDHPGIILKLCKYFREYDPHIVQTYILKPNLYGRIAARLAGVPVVISTELTLRDQAPTALKRLRDLFLHPLNALLNNTTDMIICASEAIKRQWETGGTEGRIEVVYPPFKKTRSGTKPPRKIKGVEKNGNWVVGIVARLSEEKRHVDLLQAFSQVIALFPKAKLVVVGDGYLMDTLKKTTRDLNMDHCVVFAGFQQDVFKFLLDMDLFVLPSRTEGSPISIFEAMYAGLPVVSTTVGGIPEVVVNDVNGTLVPPCDPDALAKAIIDLLSDPEKMCAMGEEGKRRVMTNFNPDLFIERHEHIYTHLTTRKLMLQTPTHAESCQQNIHAQMRRMPAEESFQCE